MFDLRSGRVVTIVGWGFVVASALIWVGHSAANAGSSEALKGGIDGAIVVAQTAEAPKAYLSCKPCHGADAKGNGKLGPNLHASKLTLDQWVKQTQFGSKWDGKPPVMEGFEKKTMLKQKKSDADVKAIYEWVQGMK